MKKLIAAVLALTLCPWVALAETSVDIRAMPADELLALWTEAGERLKALGAYPYVELSSGSQGVDVLALQARLAELHYYTAEPTGRFDAATVKAVKAFEKGNALPSDGVMSIEEQALLYDAAAIAKPTPTPTATPAPSPTPAPDYALVTIVGGRLSRIKGYPYVRVIARNRSPYTVDQFQFRVRAIDKYGDLLSWGGVQGVTVRSFIVTKVKMKPNQKNGNGSQYFSLEHFPSVRIAEVALYRYHTIDGKTVDVPEEALAWYQIKW